MLKNLLEKDRRLRIDHKKLLNCGYSNHDLFKVIDGYLNDFATYNNLSIDDIDLIIPHQEVFLPILLFMVVIQR